MTFLKLGCLLAGCVFALQPLSAQSKRHEIKVGIGFGNDSHYTKVMDDYKKAYHLEAEGECFGLLLDCNLSIYGEYLYHLNSMIAVGGTIGYSTLSGSIYDANGYYYDRNGERIDGGPSIGIDTHTFFVMPTLKATWVRFPHVSLYSRGAAGLAHYKLSTEYLVSLPPRDESRIKGIYQVSPIGVEVGGEHVRFFSELGYGVEGIFSLGATWHFGKMTSK